MVARFSGREGAVRIDTKFILVCEPGSIEVCSCVPDIPVSVGARVDGNRIFISTSNEDPATEVRVVLRLTGIRRGFKGVRFPDRTREQFVSNERFINSAYDQ